MIHLHNLAEPNAHVRSNPQHSVLFIELNPARTRRSTPQRILNKQRFRLLHSKRLPLLSLPLTSMLLLMRLLLSESSRISPTLASL